MSADWETENFKGYYHSSGVAVFTHDDNYITLLGPEEVEELRSMTDEWQQWGKENEADGDGTG